MLSSTRSSSFSGGSTRATADAADWPGCGSGSASVKRYSPSGVRVSTVSYCTPGPGTRPSVSVVISVWPGAGAAVRVRQWAAREGDANGLAGGRGGGLDREPHHDRHLLVAAELGLRRHLQLDAADARPRQDADGLDPEAIEVFLVVAEPPAPGVVEPEEEHRTRAGERLEDQRVVLAGGAAFGGSVRVNGEHDRVGLSSVARRVPVRAAAAGSRWSRPRPRPARSGRADAGARRA